MVTSELWPAPAADAPLDATVRVPGSKSITARALVIAAIADSPTTLVRPLRSRDTDLMVGALRALGVDVAERDEELRVTPAALRGNVDIDVGLAGTVMRFVPPIAALAAGPVTFDGDPRSRERPLRPLLDALRALGVERVTVASPAVPSTSTRRRRHSCCPRSCWPLRGTPRRCGCGMWAGDCPVRRSST